MPDKPPPLQVLPSPGFASWLDSQQISLAFTTYQTNRLFLVGTKEDGSISLFERLFDRPMGLCVDRDRLWMSSRWQLWQLDNALSPEHEHKGYDRLYVPRKAITTGALNIHDIALNRDREPVFVNTEFSCLATVSDRYSFRPIWKPPFISDLAPEDRCHLNGLAMRDGAPAYVTAVSRSDEIAGWRDARESGGCLIDVAGDEIVANGLSMPHSPRLQGERLWLLNSGTGELGTIDLDRGKFEPLTFCPGFLRGLAIVGNYAIVGLSKQREDRTFSGLPLDTNLSQRDMSPQCGLWVVDLRSGEIVHSLALEGVVIELFDVQAIEGARRPCALGFRNDEIQRFISIETDAGPSFTAHEPLDLPDRNRPDY